MSDGLRAKYIVRKAETGEAVENCFVLRPEKDPAAIAAIRAYAAATNNPALSADLLRWVGPSPNDPLTLDELREMDGEPVVLPCKVGDLLYEVDNPEYGVITCRVLYINYFAGPAGHVPGNPMVSTISIGVEVVDGHGKGSSYCFEREDIGKLVFLTRQEAQGAILAYRRKPEGV